MKRGWIRFWRKALDNEIIKDETAWHIFTWLLLKVDRKNGKKKTGRFWASEELGMKSTTFYKALKRLEKKYKMVTLQVTTKNTEISLTNWYKYQSSDRFGNNKVTTKEQQSNTLQEYKNIRSKEYNTKVLQPKAEKNSNHPYGDIIEYCKSTQNLTSGFVNYVKQATAVKKILMAGYSLDDIRFVVEEMSNDPYWKNNPFDLMSVANQMHKYMNRVVMFKKGGGKHDGV